MFLQQLKITFRRDPTNARLVVVAPSCLYFKPEYYHQSNVLVSWSVSTGFHILMLYISISTLLHRPRINKLDSIKDREQKSSGNYFFMAGGDGDDTIG